MNRLPHQLRLLVVALSALWAMALNHRQVVVARVVPAARHSSEVAARKNVVVVRERISLESTHADVLSVAGPALAWLPLDPLTEWLVAQCSATLARVQEGAPAALTRPLVRVFAGLLGTALAPQAP